MKDITFNAVKKHDFVAIGWRVIITIYTLFLLYLHFIRMFNETYWCDDAFSINTINAGFFELFHITAADVHPPLYYVILWLFANVFGHTGVVYHFVTFFPFFIILLLANTVIWKWFGKETTIVFITFCTLLKSSVENFILVRMYSWAILFVLVAFLALYKILTSNKNRYWICFVVASLAAAYTHYYCLISVAFFYVVLILDTIIRNRQNFKKVIITCLVTVLGYLPWLFVLLETFARTSESFWMTGIAPAWAIFIYVFDGNWTYLFWTLFIIAFIIWMVIELKNNHWKLTNNTIWVWSGIFSLVGTVAVGVLVSVLIRPMFIPRYIYPASIVIWLLFGVFVSKMKYKTLLAIIISGLVVYSGWPIYYSTYLEESVENEKCVQTYAILSDEIEKEDVIVTNSIFLDWSVAETYFPDNECVLLEDYESVRESNVTYWFFMDRDVEENLPENLTDLGYSVELVSEEGVIGTYYFKIYKVAPL